MSTDVFVAMRAGFYHALAQVTHTIAIRRGATHIEDAEDVFTFSQPASLIRDDITIIPAQPIRRPQCNTEGQEKGNEPRQHHDPVIPAYAPHNEEAGDQPRRNKD